MKSAVAATFTTSRSTVPRTTLDLAATLSLGSTSPVSTATARFNTDGYAADDTAPISVIGAVAAGASAAVRVHVTTAPATTHVYPAPTADVNAIPAGSVSITVNVGSVSVPALRAVSVHVALPPTVIVSAPVLVIATFDSPPTAVTMLVRSFAAPMSPVVVTRAMFVTVGTAPKAGVTTTVTATFAPAASTVLRRQVTTPVTAAHAKPGPAADTNASDAGSESTSRIVSVVAPVPTFDTVSVYVAGDPTRNAPTATLATDRSGVTDTATAPVVALLSSTLLSPAELTHAVFTTLGNAAAPTLTFSVTLLESFPATIPPCVHVTTWPAAAHDQPVPVPLVNPMPAGNVSTIVVGALVATGDTLRATRSYRPARPTDSVPTTRLSSCILGAAITGIAGVTAVSFDATRSPTVLADARFTKLGAAPAPTRARIVTESDAPTASGAVRAHCTVAGPTPHENVAVTTVDRNVSPAGNTSRTRIVSVVAADPPFVTLILNRAVSPRT